MNKLPRDRNRPSRNRTKRVHLLHEGRGACGLKLKGRRKAIAIVEAGDIEKITCRKCLDAEVPPKELVPVAESQPGL